MKRILVTGGFGFIGSNYIRYMMNKYENVFFLNIDKLTYAANQENLENLGIGTFIKDINDPDIGDLLIDYEIDTVVNFAAETHVDRSIESDDPFIQSNLLGVINLIQQIKNHKPNTIFHQISTDEVYGSIPLSDMSTMWAEHSPYLPNSPYAASKAAAEHFIRAYGTTYGLKWLITNASNNYGPYCNIEKFIPKAITNLIQDKRIPMYGDGSNIRDWIHVEDHCAGLDAVQNIGEYGSWGVIGSKYNVGGDGPVVSNKDVLTCICNVMGKDPKVYIQSVTDRLGHDKKYLVDSIKLYKKTGWTPKKGLVQGLEETIDWYRNNRSWWEVK